MELAEVLLLGVALSMDAFAVSVCKGLGMKRADLKSGLTCGLWFGGFQALMPTLGFFLAMLFASAIEAIDHWVAFILLGIIGVNMLTEAFSKEEEESCGDLSVKTMFVMAVATSIDACAAGISLAMDDANIWLNAACIGITTCILSAVGVKVGSIFGCRLGKKAQLAGGIILILLGTKILLEHLNVIHF